VQCQRKEQRRKKEREEKKSSGRKSRREEKKRSGKAGLTHFRFLLRASARLNSFATFDGGHFPFEGFHPWAQAAMKRR